MTVSPFVRSYIAGYQPYKNGGWCYEDGCIMIGLAALHGATGERWYVDRLREVVDANVGPDGSIAGYDPAEHNIDNILPGRALLALQRITGEVRYARAADRQIAQLETHPRTTSGSFWHKRIYPHQVWLDGLYMALPFMVEAGVMRGRPDLIDDAVHQLGTALDRLHDPATGLFFHGFDDARVQRWADPDSGLSPGFWTRSMGWLAMALADLAALLPADHPGRARVFAALADLAAALRRYQAEDGRWWQVTDRPDCPGNYLETSATAMIAAALLKGARLGALGRENQAAAIRAAASIEENCLVADGSGRRRLVGICHVAGLGGFGDHYRDGSPGYYVSEPIVSDDPKGVGPYFLILAEMALMAEAESRVPA